MTHFSFPAYCRNPLPICCVKTTKDSVGRTNNNVSTDGISTPSLNKSTVKITSNSNVSSLIMDSLRVRSSVFEVKLTHSIPCSLKNCSKNSACSIDEQNASVRVCLYCFHFLKT